MFAHLHAGGDLYFIAGILLQRKDKQRVMREKQEKRRYRVEIESEVGVESQACLTLLEQLEVLERRCVKAPFLSGPVHPDFAVSLVSTLLGDNGAFWGSQCLGIACISTV